jgi:hypothetical protein
MGEKAEATKVICADCGKMVIEMNNSDECLNHFCHTKNIIYPEGYSSTSTPDFLECDCGNIIGILAEDKNKIPAYYLIAGRYKLEVKRY